MIDIEKQVYTAVASALRESYPGVAVAGEHVNAPSSFPFVSIVEADNYESPEYVDSSDVERYATVMYEVNIYSNKGSGERKSECKTLLNTVSDVFRGLGFGRLSALPVPNKENRNIYRLVARYRATTDGTKIYRR